MSDWGGLVPESFLSYLFVCLFPFRPQAVDGAGGAGATGGRAAEGGHPGGGVRSARPHHEAHVAGVPQRAAPRPLHPHPVRRRSLSLK
eukprot:344462-Prorocentrum_minimum.AAC.1